MTVGSKPPVVYKPSSTFRGGLEVDVPMQMARVINWCYQEPIEYWETTTVECTDGSGEIHVSRKRTESRCHRMSHTECEIFQDHCALGLDTALLPCQGAPMPDEIIGGRCEDGVDVMQSIRDISGTDDIYPSSILTDEEYDLHLAGIALGGAQ